MTFAIGHRTNSDGAHYNSTKTACRCGEPYSYQKSGKRFCRPCSRIATRRSRMRSQYGLTLEQVEAMYAIRKGKCDICNLTFDKLHVDHDHETGAVRGMLCIPCNTSVDWAARHYADALEYVRKGANR